MLLANVSQTTSQVMTPTLPRGLEMYGSTIDPCPAALAVPVACPSSDPVVASDAN